MSPSDRRRVDPGTLGILLVALAGGVLVLLVATELFPYHSSNHDEGVYLQHARILLSGDLWMTTPLPETFQHWFFIHDGTRLYSKYQPVVPAMFALGVAVGAPRLVLAGVAVGIAGLVGLLARAAYGDRVGVVASVLVVASPLYLINTALFLPYAPTTLLNLGFAYAYVRAHRAGAVATATQWATLSGVAVGLAFFARPYTAVLFALPFVGHALLSLVGARTDRGRRRRALARTVPVALLGSAFVLLTLMYNAVLTGDPFLFPYQAFAPADGLGFGHRQILGYERTYTPELAVRANARVLWEMATRWTVAPPFGVLAALAGAAFAVRDARDRTLLGDGLSDATLRLLLVAVGGSVIVGNVAFWGNLNVLADLSDPTDGLAGQFGTFYHYDLLLPVSAFAAAALVRLVEVGWGTLRSTTTRRRAVVVVLAVTLVAAPVVVGAQADALEPPIEENREYTERFENAYEPMDDGQLDPPEGVVFVPTPYGPWLGHPFQALFNTADLRGDTVFAQQRGADATFAVLDSYPDRSLWRFTYRGEWTPVPRYRVHGAVQRLSVRRGTSPTVSFETGAVGRPSTVRLSDGDEAVTYRVAGSSGETFTVRMALDRRDGRGRATLVSSGVSATGDDAVTFTGSDEVSVAVTYVQAGGATVTYRYDIAVDVTTDGFRLVWPPEIRVCRLTPDCGHEGTYLPGRGDYLSGVRANVSVEGAS